MPRQRGAVEDRGDHLAVHDQEEILAAPLADQAAGSETDRLRVAVPVRFEHHQRGQRVVPRRLGPARDGVGPRPVPRRHAHVDPPLERLIAEVGAPGPHRDVRLDRAVPRVHARRPEAPQHHGADVAGGELVPADGREGGVGQLVDRVVRLHPVGAARHHQPSQVIVQPEDRRTPRRFVAAHALEDRRRELHREAEDVHVGVLPADERPVLPDPGAARQHAGSSHYSPASPPLPPLR